MRLRWVRPALLTRMSIRPRLVDHAWTRAIAALQESGLLTSQTMPMAFAPVAAISAAAAWTSASSRSRSATLAPWAANSLAIALPMPRSRPAPEITATRPSSSAPVRCPDGTDTAVVTGEDDVIFVRPSLDFDLGFGRDLLPCRDVADVDVALLVAGNEVGGDAERKQLFDDRGIIDSFLQRRRQFLRD